MSLLEARGLTVVRGRRRLCHELQLQLGPGEIWGVLGGNGCGKTTLLHTLAGLRAPERGQVLLDGRDLQGLSHKSRARRLGVLLQDDPATFPATVLESVLMGRHPHLAPWQWETDHDRELAYQALEQVELCGFAERSIDQLSGGERQRLKIATLLVQAPGIWLLDEPNNHLDLNHRIQLISRVVSQVKAEQGALLMSLHDLQLASRFCDKVLLMFDQGETRQGNTGELLDSPLLSRLYQHPIQRLQTEAGPVFIPR